MGANEMTDIEAYIVRFLLGDHLTEDVYRLVGYTSDPRDYANYKLVIVPSGFFNEEVYGTASTLPRLPLPTIENIPLLFGSPDVTRVGDTLVTRADFIASAFFLISRYEEWMRKDCRDKHGRFPGKESLPARGRFIDRAVIDEYGSVLRKWLRQAGCNAPEPPEAFRRIHLTHDVDAPFRCRTWKHVARETLKGNIYHALRWKYGKLEDDPLYTFPWMLKQGENMRKIFGEEHCQSIVFFRAGGSDARDKPHYDLNSKDMQQLLKLCRGYEVIIGLHTSYEAGRQPGFILSEKQTLEKASGFAITQNRHHFLTSREPEDMEALEASGLTDDYTMGYADMAGFRLGTSRAVRYINPATRRLSSSLTLHPLTVMDSTLSEPKYMNLDEGQALRYCMHLAGTTRKMNGELTLLWHNTSATLRCGYLKNLYSKILYWLTM